MNDHPLYARIVALALGAILAASAAAEAQTSQGPASGTSASAGSSVNTASFGAFPFRIPILRPRAPKHTVLLAADPPFLPPGLGPVGSNEQDDLGRLLGPLPIALRVPSSTTDFQGLTFTGFIPPDPTLAAGPNHLMPVVNSDFAIFDKTGNNLQQIDASTWYNGVLPGNSAFDPKIIYDHFANRWVMVWLSSDFATQSFILISVSDDSDPNGAWCNCARSGGEDQGPLPARLVTKAALILDRSVRILKTHAVDLNEAAERNGGELPHRFADLKA